MPLKKKKIVKKTRKVAVNRKFLLDLANSIYNPKTKSFLRLCVGKLQNGPDPTDSKRPMHCGLGELYYAMTGKQPETTGVSEEDVVDLAVKLSPLNGQREAAVAAREAELVAQEKKIDKAIALLQKMNLPNDAGEGAIDALEDAKCYLEDNMDLDDEELTDEFSFRQILDSIPGVNDSCADGSKSCSVRVFRERAMAVANKLRDAADYLPH